MQQLNSNFDWLLSFSFFCALQFLLSDQDQFMARDTMSPSDQCLLVNACFEKHSTHIHFKKAVMVVRKQKVPAKITGSSEETYTLSQLLQEHNATSSRKVLSWKTEYVYIKITLYAHTTPTPAFLLLRAVFTIPHNYAYLGEIVAFAPSKHLSRLFLSYWVAVHAMYVYFSSCIWSI